MHDIRGWIALVALLLFTIILFWVGQARAQPLPLPKQGQCSGGYEQSGSIACRRMPPVAAPRIPYRRNDGANSLRTSASARIGRANPGLGWKRSVKTRTSP